MKTLVLVVILLHFISLGRSGVKIWKHDDDINNPAHWAGGKAGLQCDGLDMTGADNMLLAVDELKAKRILLPEDMILYLLDGASIVLNETGNDELNCVRLQSKYYIYGWLMPRGWTVVGAENNVAVPQAERVPCHHDDVIFPKGWMSSLCRMKLSKNGRVRLRSFKFGEDYLTNADLNYIRRNMILPVFPHEIGSMVDIDGKSCEDPTGCLCGNDLADGVCDYEPRRITHCLDPVKPIGFCSKICGASILITDTTSSRFRSTFNIGKVKKALAEYSSDTHVSKVKNGSQIFIQIIFAEKQFSGTSLDEADDFRSRLLSDSLFGVTAAQLMSSGPRYVEGESGRTALSIVFGTLCGVLLVFGLIFMTNSPRFDSLNLRNRYRFASRPLSALLAKYESNENEGLIVERASIAGSVISLDKSFDNPMYGTSAPSTSGGGYGTVERPEEEVGRSEMVNPMYEIGGLDEIELKGDPVDEGSRLVDFATSE